MNKNRAVRFHALRGISWLVPLMWLCSITVASAAATASTLSLDDAIKATLRGDNTNIGMQDERVTSAEAAEKQARGAFDWTVHTEGGWQRLYYPRAIYGVTPNLGVLTNDTQIGSAYYTTTGFGKEFRDGIQINPGVTAYPGAGASAAQTLGLTELRPSLGLKIPLMRGLGEDATDATEKAAKETLRGTRFDREYAIQHLLHDTVQIFWRCVAADQIAKVSEQADRDAADYNAGLDKLVKRGLLEPTIAQRSVAINVPIHLTAQQAEDTTQSCRQDLRVAIAGTTEGALPAPAGQLPDVGALGPSLDSLVASGLLDLALNNRPDLKAAQRYIQAAADTRAGAEDSTSAELDLHIDYNTAYLSYTQSIENNTAEGAAASAASSERQALLTFRQLQTQAQIDIDDALRTLKRCYSDYRALGVAEKQMEKVVSDGERRARLGIGSSANLADNRKDLLLAHSQLAQLQTQLISTQLQFASGLAALRLATGTIDPDDDSPARIADEFRSLPTRG